MLKRNTNKLNNAFLIDMVQVDGLKFDTKFLQNDILSTLQNVENSIKHKQNINHSEVVRNSPSNTKPYTYINFDNKGYISCVNLLQQVAGECLLSINKNVLKENLTFPNQALEIHKFLIIQSLWVKKVSEAITMIGGRYKKMK